LPLRRLDAISIPAPGSPRRYVPSRFTSLRRASLGAPPKEAFETFPMYLIDLVTDPNAWAALAALTALEIVLGIDNVIFISLLVSRLDPRKAKQSRRIGLALAFVFRVLMLASLTL